MTISTIELPMEKIAEFCDRWQIIEFALFGSMLRDDSNSQFETPVLKTGFPDADR
ncbi:hypothetical protein [Phormidesmis sp. 146-33]